MQNKVLKLFGYRGTFGLVLATNLGTRNGYARVPDDHPMRHFISEEARQQVAAYSDTDFWRESSKAIGMPVEQYDPADLYRRNTAKFEYELTWGPLISVHGGITFANEKNEQQLDEWIDGQHDGVPPGLWLGFDTAHAWDAHDIDLINEMNDPGPIRDTYLRLADLTHRGEGQTVWTTDMVVAEVKSMIDQIVELANLEALRDRKEGSHAVS